MFRNTRSGRRGAKPRRSRAPVDRNTKLLERLVEDSLTTRLAPPPNQRDVQRIDLGRRSGTVTIRRTWNAGSITPLTTNVSAILEFTLLDFDPNQELAPVFQRYRMLQVTCHFIPHRTVWQNSATNIGDLHSAIVYKNVTVPTTVQELIEYNTHQVTNGQLVSRTLHPANAIQIGVGSNVGTAAQKSGMWLDTNDDQIGHFGVIYLIEGANPPPTLPAYDLQIEAVIQLADPK